LRFGDGAVSTACGPLATALVALEQLPPVLTYRVASKAATQIEGDGYWIVHQLRVVTIRGFGHQ
jgi:hypothetical protein